MAAKLGAEVDIVTRIGGDSFAAGAVENYRKLGVGIGHVSEDRERVTGVAPIFVDDTGQNFVVIVPGANAALDDADVAAASAVITASDALVCQLEVPVETVHAAFVMANTAGVLTIFNPAPAGRVPDELWKLTDVAVPNETEAEALTGIAVSDDGDAERAARSLMSRGARAAIVTLGRRGSLVVSPAGVFRIDPIDVSAVDSTGAGDAYVGTLAVCLGSGWSLFEAARRANIVAALSVRSAGTQTSFPDRATACAALAAYGLELTAG